MSSNSRQWKCTPIHIPSMHKLKCFVVMIITSMAFFICHIYAAKNIEKTPQQKQQAFINHMVKTYKFQHAAMEKLLLNRPANAKIIKTMNRPYEAQPWTVYRRHFITQQRISGGVKYWKKYKNILQQAEKKYGVPASVIVAIIGVESNYGHHKGHYHVIDALNTLAFYFPRREKFFRSELEAYLKLCKQRGTDPTELQGSYAGAIGLPQFMPSNVLRYAVSAKNKGEADLTDSDEDAILSIANYLKSHGWQKQKPIANLTKPLPKAINDKNGTIQKVSPTVLYFKNQQQANYWRIYKNFKVIKRYNPRNSYAMAVTQLSDAIKQAAKQKHKT